MGDDAGGDNEGAVMGDNETAVEPTIQYEDESTNMIVFMTIKNQPIP
jgi:hypothetical protein